MSAGRVLITDNDSKSVHLLRQIMSGAGFEVLSVNKVDRALQMSIEEQPLFILVEIDLQTDEDGIDLIRRLREFSDIPVMAISTKTDPAVILRAFEAGADDFVTRPFDARILLARVNAIVKRCKAAPPASRMLSCGGLSINLASHQVTVDNDLVSLTQTEFNLLVELAKHSDQVMVHEQLLRSVWGPQYSHEIDYLRSYVHTLRRKLEKNPSQPSYIVSLSGVGYMLVSNPSGITGK